jgi:hypothetical protein
MLKPHPAQTHLMDIMRALFDENTVFSVDIQFIQFASSEEGIEAVPARPTIMLYASDNNLCNRFSRTFDSVIEAEAFLNHLSNTEELIEYAN